MITPFVALSGIPSALADWLGALNADPYLVLVLCLGFFILLGTFLEGFAILILALPLVQPIMEGYGFDMVWFGVMMVIVLEMGLISPPVGINVFVVKGIAPDVPMNTIFRRHLALLVRHDAGDRPAPSGAGHRALPAQHDVRLTGRAALPSP